jgi:ribosomal protein S18 acetylase RimI-like enzyme
VSAASDVGPASRRPFDVDPDVMARIRPMREADVPDVARLHHAAMGNSLWARLGRPFLEALYRGLLRHPSFLGAVYLEDGRVRGFIAGTEDSGSLFGDTFRRAGLRLVLPTLRGIRRDPGTLRHLVQTPLYFRRSQPAEDVAAESLFCSFEPDLRGKRVSGHINKALFDELRARGHRAVKITTEADNEGARRQLGSWGFAEVGRFRFYGKDMITYVLDLAASPRVEPVRRWGTA